MENDVPEFGVGPSKLVSEQDDTGEGALLSQNRQIAVAVPARSQQPGKDDKNMVVLQPMSPLVASATVVNLLLATGPFS